MTGYIFFIFWISIGENFNVLFEVVEFQCVDGKVLGKPKVEFTAFNFYSRYPKVDNKTEQAMLAAARSKGLGIYMDAGWGKHYNCFML